jgi:hypothetical protein
LKEARHARASLAVRPSPWKQLQRQAKEFLRACSQPAMRMRSPNDETHPEPIDPAAAKLADAHLVLRTQLRRVELDEARPRGAARGGDLAR